MKIICIGRNYADHARELGNQVPSEPVVFLKPQSAILSHKHPFYIPEWTQEVHHEVELVVKIDRLGKTISEAHAPRYYSEVSLGLDLTARDVQTRLKAKGHPWERAKAFDGSAVIGQFVSLEQLGKDVQDLSFSLTNLGETLQEGQTKDMLFSVNRLIAEVSKFMTLKVGDSVHRHPAGSPQFNRAIDLWVRWKARPFASTSSDFVILSQTHTHLSLIGFMGSEIYLGKKLAERLDRPFVDTDGRWKRSGNAAVRCSTPWGNRLFGKRNRMPCPMPFDPTMPLFWRQVAERRVRKGPWSGCEGDPLWWRCNRPWRCSSRA